jgi:hypothetical protein
MTDRLWSADSSLWRRTLARHNRHVLDALPAERLLVVRTHKLLARLPDIAAFAMVPAETLRPDRGWEFRTSQRHRLLAALDPIYVQDTAEHHCGDLIRRFFRGLSWDPAARQAISAARRFVEVDLDGCRHGTLGERALPIVGRATCPKPLQR